MRRGCTGPVLFGLQFGCWGWQWGELGGGQPLCALGCALGILAHRTRFARFSCSRKSGLAYSRLALKEKIMQLILRVLIK